MTLDQYIDNINKRYKLGNATEHTFRGDLQQLLESLVPDKKFQLDLLKLKTLATKTF